VYDAHPIKLIASRLVTSLVPYHAIKGKLRKGLKDNQG